MVYSYTESRKITTNIEPCDKRGEERGKGEPEADNKHVNERHLQLEVSETGFVRPITLLSYDKMRDIMGLY